MNTQALVDLTQSLGWIINQENSEPKPTQMFSFVGYEYHLDSVLVKPTQKTWLKLQDLILQLKSTHVSWVTCLNGENGPGGMPSHEALSVSPQEALEISSVIGQPPSLDRNHFRTPRVVAEFHKCDERLRPSSQRPQYPTRYRHLKRRPVRSLRTNLYKGSVVGWGKKLHINVLELKVVSLALRSFKDQCQNQTMSVAADNSTVVAYINKQGGTHSAEMCTLLWKIMTWFYHYQITLKARPIPGCLNVMADLLSSRTKCCQPNGHCIHRCSDKSVRSGSPLM